LARAREEDPSVVYCDAGNFLTGTPEVDASQGKISVAVYNYLKPTVVNVSERELASGIEAFRAARKDGKFDFVSANLVVSGSTITQPFVIKPVKEAKVAFIGVCGTREVMRYDSSKLPQGVEIKDPLTTVRSAMNAVQGKADLIVLLSTCGDAMDSTIARNVPGIDLIVGGRSYRPNESAPWVLDKTRLVRTEHDGRSMGRMDMVFGADRKIKTFSATRIGLDAGGPSDEKMLALVRQFIPKFVDNPAEGVRIARDGAAK
jgi:5'-nucleotidase / UDP-sugar diphosphatase